MACERCRKADVARNQERRRRLKVEGKCVYCAVNEPEEGHWACRPCLDVKRAKRPHKRVGSYPTPPAEKALRSPRHGLLSD